MNEQVEREIYNGEGSSVKVVPYPNKLECTIRIPLTLETFHVMEYALNSMVGLKQQERIIFKEEVRRDVELRAMP